MAVVQHLVNRHAGQLGQSHDGLNPLPNPHTAVRHKRDAQGLRAPNRCRCMAANSATASGPSNVPSTVAFDSLTIRPCSSWTKIVSNFGSRQSAVNVRRARFRDRPGTFSHGKPSAFVALPGPMPPSAILHESACAPPSICTDTRFPASSVPASSFPAPQLQFLHPQPPTSLVRTGLRSCGSALHVQFHTAAFQFLPCELQRGTERRLPRDSALQSGCAAFTEAELHQFDVHPRRFFVSFDRTTPSVGHSTTT